MKYKGKTKQEWLDHYNALDVDGVIAELVRRIYPGIQYGFEEDGRSYENLIMANKPPISLFETELETFKTMKIAKIEVIFVDLVEVKEITDRLALLKHPTEAAIMASGRSNAKMVIRKLIKDKDLDLLAVIEAKDVEFETYVLAENDKTKTKKDAKMALSGHIDKLNGSPTAEDLKAALLDVLKIMDG